MRLPARHTRFVIQTSTIPNTTRQILLHNTEISCIQYIGLTNSQISSSLVHWPDHLDIPNVAPMSYLLHRGLECGRRGGRQGSFPFGNRCGVGKNESLRMSVQRLIILRSRRQCHVIHVRKVAWKSLTVGPPCGSISCCQVLKVRSAFD